MLQKLSKLFSFSQNRGVDITNNRFDPLEVRHTQNKCVPAFSCVACDAFHRHTPGIKAEGAKLSVYICVCVYLYVCCAAQGMKVFAC